MPSFFLVTSVVTSGYAILHFWHVSSGSYECIHDSSSDKMKELLLLPLITENLQWLTTHVWHASVYSACLESTWCRSVAVSWECETHCSYSHFCCSHFVCHTAVFREHGTNTLHICHVLWLGERNIFCILFIKNGVHQWTVSYDQAWVPSHVIQEIMTLPWCFSQVWMKLYHMPMSVCAVCPAEWTDSFISPSSEVRAVATQCCIPFPVLVAKWHGRRGNFRNNVILMWDTVIQWSLWSTFAGVNKESCGSMSDKWWNHDCELTDVLAVMGLFGDYWLSSAWVTSSFYKSQCASLKVDKELTSLKKIPFSTFKKHQI